MSATPAPVTGWGPFARWPRTADAALAVLILVLSLTHEDGPGDSIVHRSVGDLPVSALLLFVLASAALVVRRRAPLAVLAVVLAAWAATLGNTYSDLGGQALIALYSAGRYAASERWGQLGVGGAVAVLAADGVLGTTSWAETGFGAFVMLGSWYGGRRLRQRGEAAERAERAQQAEARRIVDEERTRIARELHDVVAHTVSLMTVQAGAAKTVARDDPDAAVRAMGAVEAAGRQALDELRHLLGVLRPDGAGEALGPQPGLADLPRLVEQARQAGLDVTFATDAVPSGLPARVELSAYRIVQECLTNVVKHAGPAAHAEVQVTHDGVCLGIDVSDDGHGATVLPGSRHGVIGMRERALLLGGSLDVGPRVGGGFRVHARLPVQGVPT